jgi:hypothetical protein
MEATPRFGFPDPAQTRPPLRVVGAAGAADPAPRDQPVVAAADAPRHLSLAALIADVCGRTLAGAGEAPPRVVARFDGPEHLDLKVTFGGPAPTGAGAVLSDAMQVLLGRRVLSCATARSTDEPAVTYALRLDPPSEAASATARGPLRASRADGRAPGHGRRRSRTG